MRCLRYFLAGSALALVASSSSAFAGGFQRGTADTDILYEQGTFATRYSLTYVNPDRGFDSIGGVSGNFGTYTGNYTIPSGAVYFGGDQFGCTGTFTEPFAATGDYSGSPGGALPSQNASDNGTVRSRTKEIAFYSNEIGATCRVSYSAEKARFSLLGGVFFEDFSFTGSSTANRNISALAGGVPLFLPSSVEVQTDGDYQTGYRIGAAYEMPEIALRAQIMYRSEVKHDDINGTGVVTITGDPTFSASGLPLGAIGAANANAVRGQLAAVGLAPGNTIAVTSSLTDTTSPQSVSLNVQTGIAQGTLLLASFRWTDWSTNGVVRSTITSARTGTSFSEQPYNWDDGYSASIGIGRAFTDKISGVVSLGYDSGVSTGADTTYTDLYTLSGGISLKPDKWGEIRFGGLVGYWTAGNQSIADGAYFNAHVDDTIVLAGTASLKLQF